MKNTVPLNVNQQPDVLMEENSTKFDANGIPPKQSPPDFTEPSENEPSVLTPQVETWKK
jgi:hypothetical protein